MEREKIIAQIQAHMECLNEIGINKAVGMAEDLCRLPEYHRDTTPEQCRETKEQYRIETEYKAYMKYAEESAEYAALTNEQYRKELTEIFSTIEDNRILRFYYIYIKMAENHGVTLREGKDI